MKSAKEILFDVYFKSSIPERIIKGQNPRVGEVVATLKIYDDLLEYANTMRMILAAHRHPNYELFIRDIHKDDTLVKGITVGDFLGDMPFGIMNKAFRKRLAMAANKLKLKIVFGYYYDPRIATRLLNQHASGYAVDVVPIGMTVAKCAEELRKFNQERVFNVSEAVHYIHLGPRRNVFKAIQESPNCLAYERNEVFSGLFTPLGWISSDRGRLSSNQILSVLNCHWPNPNP